MARSATPVTTEDVRQWARDNNWADERGYGVGDRGRLSTSLIEEYNRKHRARPYMVGQGTAAPAPAANRSTSNAPARRERTESRPSPRQSNHGNIVAEQPESPAGMSLDMSEAGQASVAEVINALTAATSASKGRGTPRLVTVTAQQLVFAG